MPIASRTVAAVATTVIVGLLASCGADDPYCVAVQNNRAALDDFGGERTDAAFAEYAAALAAVNDVAPKPIDVQWASLGRATQGVVTAHKDVGFALQDMDDEDKRKALSQDDIKVLNKAYDRFNNTTSQRKAVVADVEKTCDIQLK